jgi:hypothetical protein
MKIFKINQKIEVICNWHKTRNGFKHTAKLLINGSTEETTKVCYLNRTWESYEYQTVLKQLIEKSKVLSKDEKAECLTWADGDRTDWSKFNSIAMVAKMGEIFCDNKEDKNNWKKRMLKAGLGEGVNLPEDFDRLPEDEKERRLNGAIEILNKPV